MRIYKINKIKLNCLTNYNLLLLSINIYYKNLYNLYGINTCLSWMILITFNSTVLLDRTFFKRIRKKSQFTYLEFHIGNQIMHTLPCIYIYYYQPKILEYKHSIIAILFNLLWCYISSKGTMDLKEIYVKIDKKTNNTLHFISIVTSLSVPFIYNNL